MIQTLSSIGLFFLNACMVLCLPIIFFSCVVYEKSGYPHSLKLKEIKTGTDLEVVTERTVERVSFFSITDSLLIGRSNSNTAVKIRIRDIEEIWIRSYHDSTSREGFFIGFNLGASKSFRNFSQGTGYPNSSYSDSNMGFRYELRIGHAFSDNFVLYYRDMSMITKEYDFLNEGDEIFKTGFMGIGGTYFLKKTAPTFYGNIFFGAGFSGKGGSENNGPSFGIGLGYQFTRRWNIELNFDFMKLASNEYLAVHTKNSLSFTILYGWFRNYR